MKKVLVVFAVLLLAFASSCTKEAVAENDEFSKDRWWETRWPERVQADFIILEKDDEHVRGYMYVPSDIEAPHLDVTWKVLSTGEVVMIINGIPYYNSKATQFECHCMVCGEHWVTSPYFDPPDICCQKCPGCHRWALSPWCYFCGMGEDGWCELWTGGFNWW